MRLCGQVLISGSSPVRPVPADVRREEDRNRRCKGLSGTAVFAISEVPRPPFVISPRGKTGRDPRGDAVISEFF